MEKDSGNLVSILSGVAAFGVAYLIFSSKKGRKLQSNLVDSAKELGRKVGSNTEEILEEFKTKVNDFADIAKTEIGDVRVELNKLTGEGESKIDDIKNALQKLANTIEAGARALKKQY